MRQTCVDEFAGNREDEVGLQLRISGSVEVRECEPIGWIGEWSDGRLHAIAGEINPFEKVRHFVPADAENDAQDLQVADFLSHRRVERAATLLDRSEVECRRVSDSLNVISRAEVVVVSRNGRDINEID